MRNLFSQDSKLIQGLNRMSDLIILNLLTIICCIPIVTIGAAVTALYDAVWRMQQDEGRIYSAFFKAFRSNFKRATGLWLLFLPIGAILLFNFHTAFTSDTSLFATIFSLFGLVWWAFAISWVFPLQSRFENTFWGTVKNSLLFPMAYFPQTLAMAVINMLPWVLILSQDTGSILTFYMGGMVWLTIYFALAAHLNLKLMDKFFDRFYAEATTEETEA